MLDARAFGRISSNPVLNEHLHYAAPADINKPLYEAADDKVLDYRDDYNNRPSNSISFMPAVASTPGHPHCELWRMLFADSSGNRHGFFAASGVDHKQHNHDQFCLCRAAFYSQLKSKVGNIIAKATALRINSDIDDLL